MWVMTLEKWFTTGCKDIVKGAKAIGAGIAKVDTPATQALIEGVTSTAFPQAEPIEEMAFQMLGKALTAVKAAGAAASANGVSLTLDATASTDLQALIPAVEGFHKTQGNKQPAAAPAK